MCIMFFAPPPSYIYAEISHHNCSKEDCAKVADIITTLANNGKLSLLMSHKKRLEQLGDELTNVNPLQFLQIILEDPTLKDCLRRVEKDHFKWSNFTSSMGQKLDSFKKTKDFPAKLKKFCNDLKIPIDAVTPYLQNKDYKGFIHKIATY